MIMSNRSPDDSFIKKGTALLSLSAGQLQGHRGRAAPSVDLEAT